jgi:5S rRNA maturation endonuclease (ribonuclease M5)
MNFEAILDRFHAHKSGSQWMAKCPAHEDSKPSLAIRERDGKFLLHCHAGCTSEAVARAAGLELRELFTENSEPQIVETYDYTDEAGKLLYQVVRLSPKGFRQRKPDGKGGWSWSLNGTRRVLYCMRGISAAEMVLVEGEKDVQTALRLGFMATCNAGGAGKWRDEYSEVLRGKHVVVIPDCDEPGRKHAQQVATSLHLRAASIKILELPKAKDLTEWVEQQEGDAEYLKLFIERAKPWTPDGVTEEPEPVQWREIFHSYGDFEKAKPLSFSVDGFLQDDAATGIVGLSGHGKTFVLLSLIKAMLAGPGKLWNLFTVPKAAERVLYLIPESSIGPFGHRLKIMGLYPYVAEDRLLVRTLSKGPTLKLSDPLLHRAARGAHVFLDTAIRFANGDENSASDNQKGLANDIFSLLSSGARAVVAAYHSPKSFTRDTTMSLENALRGSGDLGAMLATCWAIKQIDPSQAIVHLENVKQRDFQACGPFQLIGRPYIDEKGDFQLLKTPGECGSLADEQPDQNRGGGATQAVRNAKASNIALLREWLVGEPNLTSKDISRKFRSEGIEVSDSAVRKYRKELGL